MANRISESMSVEESRARAVYATREVDPRYSLFNPGHLFLLQERERRLLALLTKYSLRQLERKTILEVGCGSGYWLREFINWGARPQNITGVDLSPESVAVARRKCPKEVRIECGNAAKLCFPDATFDLVLQSTVFTSVLDSDMKQQIAAEMLRVVKEDGILLWYDFHVNNPRNPGVRGVKKQEIFQLFPGCRISLRRVTLAAPLAQLLAPYSLLSCYLLERFKVFNTHYIGIIRKSPSTSG